MYINKCLFICRVLLMFVRETVEDPWFVTTAFVGLSVLGMAVHCLITQVKNIKMN